MSLRRRRRERWIILTWGVVGLGLGLILLSVTMWWRQGADAAAWSGPASLEPSAMQAVAQLKDGKVPSQAAMQWQPLWGALHKLQAQRAKALSVYAQQVQQASPAAWIVPAQLIQPEGRQQLSQRLIQLDRALHTWTQEEAMIQAEFDSALNAWFEQAPDWLDTSARQQMVEATADAARVLHEYVQLQQELLGQIRHLSGHIESLGNRVSLTGEGDGRELVFVQESDLNRYRSSVSRLTELAEQEQSQMELIRRLDREHMARLAQAIESVVQR